MKIRILALLSLVGFMPLVHADDVAAAAHGGGMSSLIMFGGLFVMMYFLMIRPQSKRAKEHRNLLATLGKDDEVVTQGGMVGKIVRDSGSFFIVTFAEGIEVPVQKQSITQLLPKGTLKSIC
jgi:preprotein translocase subunit YajC